MNEFEIYEGRIDTYRGCVVFTRVLEHDEALRLDGQRAFIISESHHLYDWIKEEYLERRKRFEEDVGRR